MMKTLKLLSALLFIISLSYMEGYSQCEPDTTCIDTLGTGRICPNTLADGYLNESYHVVITIIPPGKTYSATLQDTVEIVKIVLSEVANLPAGLTYQANADEFYVDTAYCILISGTPEETGVYNLGITVVPYVRFMQMVVKGDTVVDDTSLSITVSEATFSEPVSGPDLSLVRCSPNPYRVSTTVELMTEFSGLAEFSLYNLAGQMVYSEMLNTRTGRKRFRFTGENLQTGVYLYTISLGPLIETGKLIRFQE